MILSDMQTIRKEGSNRVIGVVGYNTKSKMPVGPILGNNTTLKHKKSQSLLQPIQSSSSIKKSSSKSNLPIFSDILTLSPMKSKNNSKRKGTPSKQLTAEERDQSNNRNNNTTKKRNEKSKYKKNLGKQIPNEKSLTALAEQVINA